MRWKVRQAKGSEMITEGTREATEISLPNVFGYEFWSGGIRHQIYAVRGTGKLLLAQDDGVNGWSRGTTVDNPQYAIKAGMRDADVKAVMYRFVVDTGD